MFGPRWYPRLLEGVWIAEPFVNLHYDSAHPIRVEGGRIRVPTGPGLGVIPDDGVLGDPVASFTWTGSSLPSDTPVERGRAMLASAA